MANQSVYVVRAEVGGEPESYILGAFASIKEAKAMVKKAEQDEDMGFSFAWFDKLTLGKQVLLSNR